MQYPIDVNKTSLLVTTYHESGFSKPIPWGNPENANCDVLNNVDCVSALNSHKNHSKDVISTSAYNGANDSYFNPNSNKYDQNAIANFNITNSNQTALQGNTPILNPSNASSPEYLLRQNVSIPFKANNSTSVNVGASKVELNITY